jgi:murein DD-endopeptidase MepM/ murein hydrolase activator NlpD
MTPVVSVGDVVSAEQQIGTLDASGCQSHAHLHVARRDPNGNAVNFTIPCTNPIPTKFLDDGTTLDNDPENPS